MLVVYLGALALPFMIWLMYDEYRDYWVGDMIFGYTFLCVGIALAVFGLSWLSYTDTNAEWRVDKVDEIVAMQDAASLSGNFCLGTGTIEGTMVYVYYTNEGESIYQFRHVDATRAEVHEVAGVKPYVETLGRHFKVWGADHLLWQSLKSDRYVFYIPPGTLKQNLNLDVQ